MTYIPTWVIWAIGIFFVLHIALATIVVLRMFKALFKRIQKGDKT